MKKEIWKDIKGYEDLYQVSNLGRIKSLHYKNTMQPKILKPVEHKNNYLFVYIGGKQKSIHRLVMETFKPDKSNFKSMPYENRNEIDYSKLEINHKDENKQNNDISNLEWCSCTYNKCYGRRLEKNSKKVFQYDLDKNFIKEYPSTREAGRQNNLDARRISECCLGKKKMTGGYIWKYTK